jgi:hypothetical protein
MPPEAIALLVFFVGVAFVVGAVAAYAVGPRRPWATILPILGAFGSLYVVGHRIGLSLGPQVNLFGFEVAIVWDVAVAIVAAVVVAVLQRQSAAAPNRPRPEVAVARRATRRGASVHPFGDVADGRQVHRPECADREDEGVNAPETDLGAGRIARVRLAAGPFVAEAGLSAGPEPVPSLGLDLLEVEGEGSLCVLWGLEQDGPREEPGGLVAELAVPAVDEAGLGGIGGCDVPRDDRAQQRGAPSVSCDIGRRGVGSQDDGGRSPR